MKTLSDLKNALEKTNGLISSKPSGFTLRYTKDGKVTTHTGLTFREVINILEGIR